MFSRGLMHDGDVIAHRQPKIGKISRKSEVQIIVMKTVESHLVEQYLLCHVAIDRKKQTVQGLDIFNYRCAVTVNSYRIFARLRNPMSNLPMDF